MSDGHKIFEGNQSGLISSNEKSGLFKLPENTSFFGKKREICISPYHHMPSNISIPYGYGYQHVCPACGAIQYAYNDICFNG